MRCANDEQAFANVTIDLMAADQEIPMDGMEFECGGKQWPLFQVKERLQRSLEQNLGTVRIANTNHEPFQMDRSVYEDLREYREAIIQDLNQGIPLEQSRNIPPFTPDDAWEYFHTYYEVGAEPSELKVIVDYNEDYGMSLNGVPNDNGVLRTKLMKGASEYLRFICINNYHFTYDVQYPLRVGIVDPVSKFGQGATFQFAFPVIINDNTPSRDGLVPSTFPSLEPATDYCDTTSDRRVDLRARGYYAAGLPAAELKGVKFDFVCVNRQCKLGQTVADSGTYRLLTNVPACSNPLMRASKEGYVSNERFLDEDMMVIELAKLKEMDLEVVKHRYRSAVADDPTVNPLQESESLRSDQEATLYLTNEDTGHTQFKTFPSDTTIEMIDDTATYSAQLILLDDETVVGGYFADNLTISYDTLAQGDTITFHVFEYTPFPRSEDEKMDMMIYLGTQEYKEELRPTVQ